MKKFTLIGILLVLSIRNYSQDSPSQAPINPDYIKYIELKSKGIEEPQTQNGYFLGEIPSPNMPRFNHFESAKKSNNTRSSFAASYDLRTAGSSGTSLLTSVKNQGSCGSCWTFTTMGSVESRLKILGAGTFDLSENNLKECSGYDYSPCGGGNLDMATAYLSRISGPNLETDDPYSTTEQNVCKSGLKNVAYISGAVFLPNDANLIKQALLDYGALYTSMRWVDSAYSSTSKTYYFSGTGSSNHAVTLVGWDDNKITAGGTGAWIIKNSWGTSWGDKGFFYISYNDTKVNGRVGYFPTKINYNANAKLYYYDKLGAISSYGWSNGDDYGLVKYVASRDEKLTKVGTWITDDSTTVSFEIYDTFNGTTLSGLLGTVSMQLCKWPGYYTFNLPSSIALKNGNDFYIKVRYTSLGSSSVIPVEMASSGYATPTIQTGVCWISDKGTTSWTAIGSGNTHKYNLCIRAYSELELKVNAGNSAQICSNSSTTIGGSPSSDGGSGNFIYNWTSNPTGFSSNIANPNVNPSITTTYTLSVNDGISTVTSAIVIIVNQIPSKPVISQNNTTLYSSATVGNQWYNKDGIIAGDTSQSIQVTKDGIYYSIATIKGCSSDTSNKIAIVSTGIDNFEKDKILISPNPSDGEFNIYIKNSSQWLRVEIINSNGQIMYSSAITNEHFEINLANNLVKGIYSIRIIGKEETIVKKVVIK